jgi:hypothetical protein
MTLSGLELVSLVSIEHNSSPAASVVETPRVAAAPISRVEIDPGTLKYFTEHPINNMGCSPNGNDSLETVDYRQRQRSANASHAST